MSNPQGEATAWSYLDNNWLKTQQLDNGAKTTFTYNTLGQMTGLTNRNGANAILSQFGHDNVVDSMLIRNGEGSVTQVKALLTGSTLNGTTDYQYDVKSQLLGESSTRSGGLSSSFNYDNAGNPTTWNVNAQSLTRTFNSNNQETTLNAGGSQQFDYDGNGNPTLYKNVATGFDVANHLTSYGTTFSAGYRSDGKRAWKQNSSGTRTYFLYDGDAIVAGFLAQFITVQDLVSDLGDAARAGRLAQRLRAFISPKVLVMDEIGYLPLDEVGATLFFQLVTARYERGSTILTSNKSFGEWGSTFGDGGAGSTAPYGVKPVSWQRRPAARKHSTRRPTKTTNATNWGLFKRRFEEFYTAVDRVLDFERIVVTSVSFCVLSLWFCRLATNDT